MKTLLTLLVTTACLFQAEGNALPDGPQVGQPAPWPKIARWLQAPPEAAQGWPAGKVVVLEFWATGCGPCVGSIPHLNQLADQFKDKPVQFIAVDDEQESVVKNFLKKTPIHAWIGLGPDVGCGQNTPSENTPYRVVSIPHTVIIDAHGRIAAITNPFTLTSEMIQSCLNGSLSAFPATPPSATNKVPIIMEYWTSDGGQLPGLVPGQYNIGIRPTFQVMIRPTPTNQTSAIRPVEIWASNQALTLQNDTLSRAIEVVFNVKQTRIVAETKLPKGKYSFYITLPQLKGRAQTAETFEAVFAQATAANFNLTIRRKTRESDVLVLRTNATSLARMAQSANLTGENREYPNEASAINKPLSSLAEELEFLSNKPVLDESGLTNHYDFDVKWKQKDYQHPNLAGMTAAVKNLGLDLVPAKKSLEVVVVAEAH